MDAIANVTNVNKRPASRGTWVRRAFRVVLPDAAKLRVMAYAACAFAACAFAGSRVVAADVKEATLAASRELAHLGDLTGGGEELVINGEHMHRTSAYTDQSVKQVLDRYEAYCAASPGVLGQAMKDVPKALEAQALKGVDVKSLRWGVMRDDGDGRGMVACFVDERAGGGVAELVKRIESFVLTSKLSEFGKFRHVYAEKTAKGDTHVITTWSDGDMNVNRMFPAAGDAEGTDSTFVPRPEKARRLLSGAAVGMPFGVYVYESTERMPAAEVKKRYDAFFAERKWKAEAQHEESGTTTYMRDDTLQVFVSVGEVDGKTYTTVVEGGRPEKRQTVDVAVE